MRERGKRPLSRVVDGCGIAFDVSDRMNKRPDAISRNPGEPDSWLPGLNAICPELARNGSKLSGLNLMDS